ncbi:MAG TPA: GIY-YIG nuclease family protein [Bacillota bacterium]|nr:GIY-YIG nuclease family protein [Bacillota bacterium]
MDRHAELKQEYKDRPKNTGVYQIKNQLNGKVFVASSPNLDGMANRFAMGVKYGWFSNGNRQLEEEMKTYGPENFTFEILDQLKPSEDRQYDYREDLKALEALWVEKLQPFEAKGYNKRK